MNDDHFEWDDAKAALNYASHGVTFETAKRVFRDPFAIERLDDREDYGEDRYNIIGWWTAAFSVSLTRCATAPFASFPHAEQSQMKDAATTKTTPKRPSSANTDWSRFDAMTETQRHQAALNDPDARPLSDDDLARMKRTPQVKIIRRALGLSQEEFAARYHIPIGTLRDWEQGRVEPDQSARAYLKVIAREPEMVREALEPPRQQP